MEEEFLSVKKLEDILLVDSNPERLVDRMTKQYLERSITTLPPQKND